MLENEIGKRTNKVLFQIQMLYRNSISLVMVIVMMMVMVIVPMGLESTTTADFHMWKNSSAAGIIGTCHHHTSTGSRHTRTFF